MKDDPTPASSHETANYAATAPKNPPFKNINKHRLQPKTAISKPLKPQVQPLSSLVGDLVGEGGATNSTWMGGLEASLYGDGMYVFSVRAGRVAKTVKLERIR